MFVPRRLVPVVVAAGMAAGLVLAAVKGDDQKPAPDAKAAIRDGFEEPQPVWLREYADAAVNLIAHERSNRAAHGGRLSERFQFEAGGGKRFFVSYAPPHIPVSDDLNVVLYVRSNRAGVQIFLRVVLPADVDPETKTPSFILVPGPIFDQVDRWQRLEMSHLGPAIEQQVRVKRTEVHRPVSVEGAYIELVLVNLMAGPGDTEVFLDDLEISPVSADVLAAQRTAKDSGKKGSDGPLADGAGDAGDHRAQYAPLRLNRNFLERLTAGPQYIPWFPTAIDAPGADVAKLRGSGFDILFDDVRADPARLLDALKRGFMFIPRLSQVAAKDDTQLLLDEISGFPHRPAVACWYLGDRLGQQRQLAARETELARTRRALAALRKLEDNGSHLTLAGVEGDLRLFTRAPVGLDMVAIKPRFWGSNVSLLENYAYLTQRRESVVGSNMGALFWAWLPAVAPSGVSRNIWGDDTPPESAWATPPVQPAQLRLMTYLALSAGYRGLIFEGDAALTRRAGEALRIEMSFLNLEIDLFEDILASNDGQSVLTYGVHDPNPPVIPPNATNQRRAKAVKELPPRPGMMAAAIPIRERKGVVLLVGDYADTAQFQPPQMAADKVRLTPVLPQGAQVFEISPGEVKVLAPTREAGGREFFVEEFDTTSLLLCTTDLSLYQRVQAQVDSVRPKAVPMAIRQAELLLAEVLDVHRRLEADGHQIQSDEELKKRRTAGIETRPPDAKDLLAKAEEYIKSARDAWEREDYAWAWAEARRACRPLRILMHGHWVQANTALAEAAGKINPKRPRPAPGAPKLPPDPPLLVPPVACPPCISFYTLPEHYIWVDWIKGLQGYGFGPNRVPSGSFDDEEEISAAGWVNVSHEFEGLKTKIETVRSDETEPKEPWMFGFDPEREARNRVIKLTVAPEKPKDLDTALPPILDFPVAAIRSPEIRAEVNNLIRISVLVKRAYRSPPGLGGVIVRDTIGGEQFQFRTGAEVARFSRVVLFRKAPANGTFSVTLGLAGYGEVYFDDFRVEVIEESPRPAGPQPGLARSPRRSQGPASPRLPDPNLPAAAARPNDARRQQR
jgi:hypothetical protein